MRLEEVGMLPARVRDLQVWARGGRLVCRSPFIVLTASVDLLSLFACQLPTNSHPLSVCTRESRNFTPQLTM
jgi:hypothetical protein